MNPGDRIRVRTKVSRGWNEKEYEYVSETKRFITVKNGNYPTSIDKFDIKCGNVKIQILEVKDMPTKEPKITKEQLLEDCRKLGTGKKAREVIAKRYGLTEGTIQNYMSIVGKQ